MADGAKLPFADETFDGVISHAVMEHVRDPFGYAKDLMRVLKPGARFICHSAFLQPVHGYPHHYFNTTPGRTEGAVQGGKIIDGGRRLVPASLAGARVDPAFLCLPGFTNDAERERFKQMKIVDLLGDMDEDRPLRVSRSLTEEVQPGAGCRCLHPGRVLVAGLRARRRAGKVDDQLAVPPGEVIDAFHKLYYDAGAETWANTFWFGVPIAKCPTDLWIYQEMIFDLRPGLIIETGTWRGGSAYFMAGICDLLDQGRIVTVDIDPEPERPAHPRVTYLQGSSTGPEMFEQVRRMAAGVDRVLVILDSDHSRDHVLAEMHLYSDLVTPGSYMIVEDTNVNGHPVFPDFGPGPMEAVDAFLAERSDFAIDPAREKLFMTFNPRGYLRKAGGDD